MNKLFKVIVREVCTYICESELVLPYLTAASLCIFDIRKKSWSHYRLRQPLKHAETVGLAVLDRCRVFCCGGKCAHSAWVPSALRTSHVVHTSGETALLPDMSHGRSEHGLLLHSSSVLVFGGCDECGQSAKVFKSCEEFCLREVQWHPLPDMRSVRCSFTPCLWRQEVYLCGGNFTDTIEVYSPTQRFFRTLDLRLPGSDAAMGFSDREKLVVVQEGKVVVIREKSGKMSADTAWAKHAHTHTLANPVLLRGRLYCTAYRCVLEIAQDFCDDCQCVPVG